MPVSRAHEAAVVREVQKDPTGHVLFAESAYRRADGLIVVYRQGLQEYLHRRLYRLLVDPSLGRKYLARNCGTHGCLNPYHYRMGDELIKGAPVRCRHGHEYTPDNLTASGHCLICAQRRAERRAKGVAPSGGEINAGKTHCPHGHSYLEPDNVYKYRTQSGWHRKCRVCARKRAASRRHAVAVERDGE